LRLLGRWSGIVTWWKELEIAGRQITASCKAARKQKSIDGTIGIAVWNRQCSLIYITLADPGQLYKWLGTPAALNTFLRSFRSIEWMQTVKQSHVSKYACTNKRNYKVKLTIMVHFHIHPLLAWRRRMWIEKISRSNVEHVVRFENVGTMMISEKLYSRGNLQRIKFGERLLELAPEATGYPVSWLKSKLNMWSCKFSGCFLNLRNLVSLVNPLALELDIYSWAHNLCKMWIFYEPRRVTLGNTRHFVEE